MYLLLSGEGKSDLGCCDMHLPICEGDDFSPGPMAWFVDQLIEQKFDLSHIDNYQCGFIPEKQLSKIAKKSLPMGLTGKKRKKETLFFYKNSSALAIEAHKMNRNKNDLVLAVLFRDSDGTNSTHSGDWKNKWDSIEKGFKDQNFYFGVPMLPKPKSEAWLLCATKNIYQHCDRLEDESGNDNSPNSLKKQLGEYLQGKTSAADLTEKVKDKVINVNWINMKSLNKFKEHLNDVLNRI